MNAITRSGTDVVVEATCVRLNAKAADAAAIAPSIEKHSLTRQPHEVVVAIEAAGVNPSDVKAATGLMPYAVFPRTPGRDFSGRVVEGPDALIGKAVFGSSGDLGIRRDGTHASHVVVEAAALVEKPDGISMDEAAGIGVPFVTAIEGFRRAGAPKPGEHVLIMGVNGKVGQAAVQLATWQGARVIGVVRKDEPYEGHANAPIQIINSSTADVAERVRELTDGHGADIVFNTVGDPYFDDAHHSLAKAGRQILIATTNQTVKFNILEFYRGRHTYLGVDTLAFSTIESAELLRSVLPGFAGGFLRPYPIVPSSIYPLAETKAAYTAVIGSSRNRVVLRPGA
ncbi:MULTISPECIES: zinc-binding alcohol dehydrogenase family protein [unclassified Bradyrhizobium]|uniref:quinone oxidoreductase family protein n=1 Tax=unclassified Bradyrhizobium TaxID=2631580 RepID=UPI001BA9BB95|nr:MULTISPECIES: zinc-binding alcohol dehydrogenase family protein [unclassified Bradyrhizobium]MBR1204344.1 zinc-binding alcohol dehydrogenase family protein [Bradyrhizobium sp. AUGA SZCCT0124]MBR1309770.1 zinc-binding alcohol dehydrogenase family protein [Bradyrhizobium sp. AUGA SZCCT0051]MBR1339911.1 zinc-binding alcohol dehydrogenase family protein [Bradyrhizobium sp. AUGA SZCCT0105]MBR1354518.1 zinc-binding alcohol dehydrogenase family protein [Bradyrhizobium sp. AUGA SZCCT0045]